MFCFLFKGDYFQGNPCEIFFFLGVQQFHHFFWRVSFFPHLSMGETICGEVVKSNRLRSSPWRDPEVPGPSWGLLKATVLSIVITASLIKHGMRCYVSTHSARWSCPSRCSSRSWGWCGSQPSSSRCDAAGCERLPWRCGHVAHSQVHAICTVRILRTLSPLHISMSSSLDANSYLVL